MRRFHSYGPVDCEEHFCVPRTDLVDTCVRRLVGNVEKGGHYFTIWAPRQNGKTWLMRQAIQNIEATHADRFAVRRLSLGGLRDAASQAPAGLPGNEPVPLSLEKLLRRELPDSPGPIRDWQDFAGLFAKDGGLWDRPLILLIDEVDTLAPDLLDMMVAQFRELYLNRESNYLHGLALVGVRAVLGVDSLRGSPFNIQRSLRVPNFDREEVADLFDQYQTESGQVVAPAVVENVYESTRGQPGLVCWFGELLTETYNPGTGKPIDLDAWTDVMTAAIHKEWNNTILNLLAKAKGPYQGRVIELFHKSDIPFTIQAEWCGYLYLNGIIEEEKVVSGSGEKSYICRFSSPFVQRTLYNGLTLDIVGDRLPILALSPLDDLADVFSGPELDLPALLTRYKDYLKRLRAKGLNPWKDQPRRADLHLTEAVGHFHLYAWLKEAVEDQCVVSPEFPTGNGKVDLHLRCGAKRGIVEVKSFKSRAKVQSARKQAADYARRMGLSAVVLALFVPVEDEEVLQELSGVDHVNGVETTTVAIGWA